MDGPRKYRNRKVEIDGYVFDSQKEARRYLDLKLMERAGLITHLCADKKQLRYDCVVNGQKICAYVADFRYGDVDGKTILEDTKGFKTRVYSIKKKLMNACYGIEIREV